MALKLTRRATDDLTEDKEGQSVILIDTSDGIIRIELERIRGSQANFSILAPDACSIVREELVFDGYELSA